MKKSDIKPGVVYALKRSKYSDAERVMFLTPLDKDHLYMPKRGAFQRAEYADRPMSVSYPGTSAGYLVAKSGNYSRHPDVAAPLEDASLEEALNSNYYPPGKSYHYELLFSLSQVTGPYDEVHAEEERQKAAEELRLETERRAREARLDRLASLAGAIGAYGVEVRVDYYADPYRPFKLTVKQAEQLLSVLRGRRPE